MGAAACLASRVRAADNVVFRNLDGEAVLLNLDTGVYFGLDRVGTRIWELLDGASTLGDVLTGIVAEFDVDCDRAERDLVDLVQQLAGKGLVEVTV